MGRLAMLAAVAALAVPVVSADARAESSRAKAAAVRDCHTYAYYPNVLISSARNMTCRAARREMRRYRRPIRRRFRTPGGFRCSRVSGGRLAASGVA
jgi:hypothetical protein